MDGRGLALAPVKESRPVRLAAVAVTVAARDGSAASLSELGIGIYTLLGG